MNKLYIRITPADAGKTTVTALKAEREQDHPRGCGENFTRPTSRRLMVSRLSLGSPPRMRGKPITEAFKADIDRITPADAGKTYPHSAIIARKEDHPRGCGENNRDRT